MASTIVSTTTVAPERPIQVRGEQGFVEVSVKHNGRLYAHYRSESISGNTLASIREDIERLDKEAQRVKDMAKARKAAEADPIPATYRMGYEPVKVRGVHKTTGDALVIRADGTKESMDFKSLLRPLEEHEIRDLTAYVLRRDRAKEATRQQKPQSLTEILGIERTFGHRKAEESALVDLAVRFDPERDLWVAEYEGDEIADQQVSRIEGRVHARLARAHGWTVMEKRGEDGYEEITPDTNLWPYTEIFRDLDHFWAYAALTEAQNKAVNDLREAEAEYLFDRSLLAERD